MALFDQAFKDEVRARNDIVEVISSYVKLERRGNRFVGLCPFHGEKTPSFHVIPEMQIYHCFGCKVSGDVFKFLQEREHYTFYEALVHLAKRARIALPQEDRTPEEEQAYQGRRALLDALDLSARFFQNQLFAEPGKAALEYLLGRGLSDETIRHFRLGWAPGYGQLHRTLKGRFSADVQQKAGLIVPRREGSGFMDAFFDRVMFPITDISGRVIGFGGRILQGNGPKYKNTGETSLFTKRHVLFGIANAKEEIRTKNQAILVEGYMDVITPCQAGIRNVVAPLGTALTDEQSALLRRQAEQVIVGFDSDTAGQMATLRGLEKLYENGCDVRILRLPDGKDPDEFIRTHGAEAFRQCVDQAVPLLEFKLDLALLRNAGNEAETKAKALEAVAQVLADVTSDVLREEYVHKVANKLAASPMDIRELRQAVSRQMNRLLRQGFQHNQLDSRHTMGVPVPSQPAGQGPGQPQPRPGHAGEIPVQPQFRTGYSPQAGASKKATAEDLVLRAEHNLLYLMLQHPSLAARVAAELGEAPFTDPVYSVIYACAAPLCAGNSGGPVTSRLLDALSDPEARLVLAEMAASHMVTADSEKEASDCIEKIKGHRDLRRREELENLMKASQAAGEPFDQYLHEYMELQRRTKKGRKA